MDKKQRLEQIKNEIKKTMGTLLEERKCMEEAIQEVYDAEVKQRELKEQMKTTEVWLEELMRNQWELEKEIEESRKPKTVWDLGDDDEYYWVSTVGVVVCDRWFGNLYARKRRDVGNVFLTEQEAEDEVRARKLIQKARQSQDRFVPDWENFEQNKCFVYFDSGEIRILIHDYRDVAPIFGYWEDELVCEQFVQDYHNELLWFFTEYRR